MWLNQHFDISLRFQDIFKKLIQQQNFFIKILAILFSQHKVKKNNKIKCRKLASIAWYCFSRLNAAFDPSECGNNGRKKIIQLFYIFINIFISVMHHQALAVVISHRLKFFKIIFPPLPHHISHINNYQLINNFLNYY